MKPVTAELLKEWDTWLEEDVPSVASTYLPNAIEELKENPLGDWGILFAIMRKEYELMDECELHIRQHGDDEGEAPDTVSTLRIRALVSKYNNGEVGYTKIPLDRRAAFLAELNDLT